MDAVLAGGLPPESELVTIDPPAADPFFGESHALWLWDDLHGIGIHLYLKTLQHIASFRLRRETVNVHLPNGTLLMSEQDGPGPTSTTIARGPNLECECLGPFERWAYRYDATAQPMTASCMRDGLIEHRPLVALGFELEATMAAPPWLLGSFTEGDALEWGRQFFGGARYEQLLTATGVIRTRDGELQFDGAGLRTHRVGTRNTATFPGHTWMAATFPSGRRFGAHRYGSPNDESFYQEAFVESAGERRGATITEITPYADELAGEALVLGLDTDTGPIAITGELTATNFVTCMPADTQRFCWGRDASDPAHRLMTQGLARYRWGDEVGIGMVERSIRAS